MVLKKEKLGNIAIATSLLMLQFPIVGIIRNSFEYTGSAIISVILFGIGACSSVILYRYCRYNLLWKEESICRKPIWILRLFGLITFILVAYCHYYI